MFLSLLLPLLLLLLLPLLLLLLLGVTFPYCWKLLKRSPSRLQQLQPNGRTGLLLSLLLLLLLLLQLLLPLRLLLLLLLLPGGAKLLREERGKI